MDTRTTIEALKKPCFSCKKHDYSSDCPFTEIEHYRFQQEWLGCPVCRQYSITINEDDLLECSECHTQYALTPESIPGQMSLNAEAEQVRLERIDADIATDFYIAWRCNKKGSGVFPLDLKIEKLKEKL